MLVVDEQALYQQFQEMKLREAENFLVENFSVRGLRKIPVESIGTVKSRNKEIEFITETFFSVYGKFPSPYILDMFGNFIMLDYIKQPVKKKSEKNPFHTDSQKERRNRHEVPMDVEISEYFHATRQFNFPKKRVTAEYDGV